MAETKSWNISAAVAYATSNAHSSSSGKCAMYVRMAIEAGGLSTTGHPVAASQYVNFLPTIGFQCIAQIFGVQNQANWTSSNARPGDIAVMSHGTYGHICIYSGNQWISDFFQTKMWPYAGDGLCYIFRFTGQVSYDPNLQAVNVIGPGGMTGATLIGECPDDIIFKKLWNMYRRLSYRPGMNVSGGAGGFDMGFKPLTTAQMINNGKIIIQFLMQRLGLTDFQAAAFAGVWAAESGCNPQAYNRQEKSGTFPGSSANGAGYGAGLAQWSHGWKAHLQKIMGLNNPIETWTMQQQLEAACRDMTQSGGMKNRFLPKLKGAANLQDAVHMVLAGYENGSNGPMASIPQLDKYKWAGGYQGLMKTRFGYAQQILNAFHGKN